MRWINNYIDAIAAITAAGDATEFSYRPPIEAMLKTALAEFGIGAVILQEPTRTQNIGAPDFRINTPGGGVIGYVECKQPGDNLQKRTTKTQLAKYHALSANIVLTDAWRWLLLRDGKCIANITLTANPSPKTKREFTDLLRHFMQADAEKIGDAKRLAAALARRCAILRNGLQAHADDAPAHSRLHGLLGVFRTALNTELGFADFADTFAQTLVYSLLLAKLKAPAGATLNLYRVNEYIPANFAVVREITTFLQELSDSKYQDIAWVAGDILATINAIDAAAVAESMTYRNGGKGFDDADDPYLYFYENFLAAYDAKQRERRGVYYTPPPVVKFIVRAVDDLLRGDFGLPNGLAETDAVTALDFAAGTGTFMLEIIRTVLADTAPAKRDLLTHGHILKNFYGFELLMAPYAIAHLKLSQFLSDNGVPLKNGERVNIFLTNTLERIGKQVEIPMMPKLAEEANRAQTIKDAPILVITGNPPYSAASQNKGDWINDLLHGIDGAKIVENYYAVDGKPLGEHNPKGLQDDYVKFIRFAQWKMEKVALGIVAIITNHGFLDNPTFRGMRQSLLNTFDALYFLDLHGNAKKKETAPEGGKDENVFDIQQSVAISILVKNPELKKKGVFHANLWGLRKAKYDACLERDLKTTQWKKLTPAAPTYLFIPFDNVGSKKFRQFWSVSDIFPRSGTGIKSHRDHFAFGYEQNEIKARIRDLINANISAADLREKYNLADTRDWTLEGARQALVSGHSFEHCLKQCLYRPFDTRWCYYGGEPIELPRSGIMQHMLAGENLGLVVSRSATGQRSWQDVQVVDKIMEFGLMSSRPGNSAPLFPLYRYDNGLGEVTRNENLNPQFRQWIDNRYGKVHSPEDILGCIYAILHSPDYRKRYIDFLRTDFPRIPFPDDNQEFSRLAAIGNQLIVAHLLRANCTGKLAELHGAGATHVVAKIRYDATNQRLYFNPAEYLAPLPAEVFHFPIGGYQPLDKYLKSRKGRTMTLLETNTLQKAANAIAFTIAKMPEIDP